MIIGFSGRMGSGKTLIADELVEKKGFIKVSFADYLKNTISKLYNIPLEVLKDPAKKSIELEIPLVWNEKIAQKLFALVDIQNYTSGIEHKEFISYRECMQYIGTDILRSYDDNFHINKTIQNIDHNKNYVFDDVRYPNEKIAIERMGGFCFYILRPNNFIISNHISETILNWTQFSYHIINTVNKKRLLSVFMQGFNSLQNNNSIIINVNISNPENNHKKDYVLYRKDLLKILEDNNYDTKIISNKLKCCLHNISIWSRKLYINIPRSKNTKNKKAFLDPDPQSSYLAGLFSADGCIGASKSFNQSPNISLACTDKILVSNFKDYLVATNPIIKTIFKNNNKDLYTFNMKCPFIIENFKYWNIKPLKSKVNEVPDIIKHNSELIKYWIVGLIDGDGSIFITNNEINIKILASNNIANYIIDKYQHISMSVERNAYVNINGVDGQIDILKFYGRYAVELYKELYNGIGLSRKWGKVVPFLEKSRNKYEKQQQNTSITDKSHKLASI